MSTFYSYIRQHLRAIAICALLIIVVFSLFFPNRWLEITNAVVLLCTLLIVFAYTDVTHEMMRTTHEMMNQQSKQFEQANRPWLYIDDLVYEQHPGGEKPVLLLVNSGKTPAQYEAQVTVIAITPLFGETPIYLRLEENPPRISEVVFPYVQEKETRYIIPLEIPENQIEHLSDSCAIQINIRLMYRMLTSDDNWPYEFDAVITVPKFNKRSPIQNTYVDHVFAK